jgi:hypothetical protein
LQHDEEIDHLLLGCVYSRKVWFLMLSKLGYQQLAPVVEEAPRPSGCESEAELSKRIDQPSTPWYSLLLGVFGSAAQATAS